MAHSQKYSGKPGTGIPACNRAGEAGVCHQRYEGNKAAYILAEQLGTDVAVEGTQRSTKTHCQGDFGDLKGVWVQAENNRVTRSLTHHPVLRTESTSTPVPPQHPRFPQELCTPKPHLWAGNQQTTSCVRPKGTLGLLCLVIQNGEISPENRSLFSPHKVGRETHKSGPEPCLALKHRSEAAIVQFFPLPPAPSTAHLPEPVL